MQVDTAAGNSKPESVDGVGREAGIAEPFALALSSAGTELLIAEHSGSKSIRHMFCEDVYVTTFAGPDASACIQTDCFAKATASGIAVDPQNANCYYASVGHSIWRFDGGAKTAALIAGGAAPGSTDGKGGKASFDSPRGLVATTDGSTLYVCDTGSHALRSIDLKTQAVSSFKTSGMRSPKSIRPRFTQLRAYFISRQRMHSNSLISPHANSRPCSLQSVCPSNRAVWRV